MANLLRKISIKRYQNRPHFVKDTGMTKHFGVFLIHSSSCCCKTRML